MGKIIEGKFEEIQKENTWLKNVLINSLYGDYPGVDYEGAKKYFEEKYKEQGIDISTPSNDFSTFINERPRKKKTKKFSKTFRHKKLEDRH